ncbi:hypothetical protein PHSC3_001007 [Chlamydiales bacterium STE3]|nr:hypothetical protein PHSC3_001007 [Chlamydiales bacterium STE3]
MQAACCLCLDNLYNGACFLFNQSKNVNLFFISPSSSLTGKKLFFFILKKKGIFVE